MLWIFRKESAYSRYNGHPAQHTSNSNLSPPTNKSTVNNNMPSTITSVNNNTRTTTTGAPATDSYGVTTTDYRSYTTPRNDNYVVGHVQSSQHEPQVSDLSSSVPSSRGVSAPARAFSNQTYVDHNEVNKSSDSSTDHRSMNGRDRYSSRDSGFPGSLERKGYVAANYINDCVFVAWVRCLLCSFVWYWIK